MKNYKEKILEIESERYDFIRRYQFSSMDDNECFKKISNYTTEIKTNVKKQKMIEKSIKLFQLFCVAIFILLGLILFLI